MKKALRCVLAMRAIHVIVAVLSLAGWVYSQKLPVILAENVHISLTLEAELAPRERILRELEDIAISADGQKVAVLSDAGEVAAFDLKARVCLWQVKLLATHREGGDDLGTFEEISFAAKDDEIHVRTFRGIVLRLNAKDGGNRGETTGGVKGFLDKPESIRVQLGQQIWTVANEHHQLRFEREDNQGELQTSGAGKRWRLLAAIPERPEFLAATTLGTIAVFSLREGPTKLNIRKIQERELESGGTIKGRLMAEYFGHETPVLEIVTSPCERYVSSREQKGRVILWDLSLEDSTPMKLGVEVKQRNKNFQGMFFDMRRNRLVVLDDQARLVFVDLATGHLSPPIEVHQGDHRPGVLAACVYGQTHFVISGNDTGVYLVDETGKIEKTLKEPYQQIKGEYELPPFNRVLADDSNHVFLIPHEIRQKILRSPRAEEEIHIIRLNPTSGTSVAHTNNAEFGAPRTVVTPHHLVVMDSWNRRPASVFERSQLSSLKFSGPKGEDITSLGGDLVVTQSPNGKLQVSNLSDQSTPGWCEAARPGEAFPLAALAGRRRILHGTTSGTMYEIEMAGE